VYHVAATLSFRKPRVLIAENLKLAPDQFGLEDHWNSSNHKACWEKDETEIERQI